MQKKQQYIDAPLTNGQDGWSKEMIGLIILLFVAIALYIGHQYRQSDFAKENLIIEVVQTEAAEVEKPYLPDISGITVDAVRAKVPRFIRGKVLLDRITEYPEFRKFLEGDAPRRLRLIQRRINPHAIVVAEGHYNWSMLYDEIHAQDPKGEIIERLGDVYTLRVPLLVLHGATLVIDNVKELRLSKQANSYLVNAGDFIILNSKIVAWDEEKYNAAKFENKLEYRPFITNWDGGNLHLAGSEFVSLGYLKGKSYGISYSACTPCAKVDPNKPPATGIIVGNKFIDIYYGFYSYEAEEVAIVGNIYEDNIVYAIDPHDRSERLIIAKNETYGTKEKHGIIVSREVNDSWIFDNYSHHNKGSGIMIDRTSVNNVIANNLVEYNEQDGITFFESQDNTTWKNILRYNKKNGVRARNSWNIKMYYDQIDSNDGTSVEVYTADLSGQKTRDFELDPYTQRASAFVKGAYVSTSGSGVFKVRNAEYLQLSALDLRTATRLFPGFYAYDESLLMDNVNKENVVVTVKSANPPPVDHETEPE